MLAKVAKCLNRGTVDTSRKLKTVMVGWANTTEASMGVQIIDQVKQGDNDKLAACELYWAHQLRAYVENGGNAHSSKK